VRVVMEDGIAQTPDEECWNFRCWHLNWKST
jgi:hypothetical protein